MTAFLANLRHRLPTLAPDRAPVTTDLSPAGGDLSLHGMGLRRTVGFGIVLIAVFFVIFGVWAAVAPLETTAHAPGQVVVSSTRKVVQHLEGGIVRQIHVRDGARVAAGDPLIDLEDVQPAASLAMVRMRLRHAAASEARFVAERAAAAEIDFPTWLVAEAKVSPEAAEVIAAQKHIFASRRKALASQEDILTQRIAQYQDEIAGLKAEIVAAGRQLALIAEERESVRFLVDRGLERRGRLLSLQRQAAELAGDRDKNRALIGRAEESIAETRLRIRDLRLNLQREVSEALHDVQGEVADLRERQRAAADVVTRTVVRAPVAGTVMNMQVFTTGGVVAPGAPLLEIVPADDTLIVEARIATSNIDRVHPGLRANVRFTAFTARNVETIEGYVDQVSADALTDERSGLSYYSARIKFDAAERARLGPLTLYPGMPAEVVVIAGQRTLLSYLVRPIGISLGRAMRED